MRFEQFLFLSLLLTTIAAVCTGLFSDWNITFRRKDELPHVNVEESVPVLLQMESPVKEGVFAKAGTIERDVIYGTADGIDLLMDVYFPESLQEAAPVIIYIHGGGWTSGDKREAAQIWEYLKYSPQGYVLISLNYRLAPAHPFPAQIEDIKSAIRHLRANEEQYHIDANRLGVIGVSAGGHLAALLGLADKSAGWDTGNYLNTSSQVAAVTVIAGPVDFTRDFPEGSETVARSVFGITNSRDPRIRKYSPVSYIDEKSPPFLILHGEKDTVVPVDQGYSLFEGLSSTGADVELVVIENAGHSLEPIDGEMNPGPLETALKILAFFAKNL